MADNQFNVTIPGLTIACKTWGNPQHPPVIALHGWLDNAASFDLVAPLLADHLYIIALDFPGHGLSSHLPDGCYYHFIDGIFYILNVIEALGFQQVHLLGHSMGACLASLIAGIAPEKIISMALIEALGPLSAPAEKCCEQLSRFYQQARKLEDKKDKPWPSLAHAAAARAAKGYLSLELANILCQRGLQQEGDVWYWRHDKRLLQASPLRLTEAQILSCLDQINAPACLIWATEGFDFCEDAIRKREQCVKNLNIHHLKGGHHVHMEQPIEVANCLNQFYMNI